MAEADIPQVYAIDHEAFPAESLFRPYSSYGRELQNSMAHYVVGCVPCNRRRKELKRAWARRLLAALHDASSQQAMPAELLVGFAGFWMMLDEAHIIAIAVREPFRGQDIGQGLLLSVVDMAAKLRAHVVTLEVRESNHVAREMYLKFGFRVVGDRPRYYSDNQETAILMSLENLQSHETQAQLARHRSELFCRECLAHPITVTDEILAEALD